MFIALREVPLWKRNTIGLPLGLTFGALAAYFLYYDIPQLSKLFTILAGHGCLLVAFGIMAVLVHTALKAVLPDESRVYVWGLRVVLAICSVFMAMSGFILFLFALAFLLSMP